MNNKKYQNICDDIAIVNKALDYTKYLTPVNLSQENEKFLIKFREEKEYNPIYVYEQYQGINFEEFRIVLQNHLKLLSVSPLDNIFRRLLKENINIINFYETRGKPDLFTENSKLAFKNPSKPLINYATSILENWRKQEKETKFDTATFSGKDLGDGILKELKKYGFEWEIRVPENLTTKVTIDPEKKTIYINGKKKYTETDFKRLIVHEVGTHIVRSENGRRQPYSIFATGLANSLATEEGLAVYSENVTNLLEQETLALYAGRVIGTSLCETASFFEIFSHLNNYLSKDVALYITQRVKKGIEDTSEAGGFTKDFVYLDGFVNVTNYIKSGNNLNVLYVGAIGLDDIDDVLELIDSGILTNKVVKPYFMK